MERAARLSQMSSRVSTGLNSTTILRPIGQPVARTEVTLPVLCHRVQAYHPAVNSCSGSSSLQSCQLRGCATDLRSETAFGNAAAFTSNTLRFRPSRRKCPQASAEWDTTADQPYGIPDKPVPAVWDVVGLGQAMVDFSGVVHDSFLSSLDLVKGRRKVVNHEERGRVLRALDGKSYKVSAGGSLSNTLVALARLGIGRGLNVAMTGSVGSDPLGDFYRTKLIRANVHFLSKPVPDGTTGTVVVLTTPDAQRTMLSYQGMSSLVEWDPLLATAISSSKMLVVEGYLWELPETVDAIARACVAAKEKGVMVALTASDVSCVLRFRQHFWKVMCESSDILFTNVDEARALAGFDDSISPSMTARHLSRFCPLVSVTDGVNGAYLALRGEVVFVPPSPCTPVDTCGAGDAYAAGVLFSLLKGVPDLASIGALSSRVAAVVVGQQGTRLREEDASEIADAIVQRTSPLREGLVVRSMEATSSLGVRGGLGEGSNGTSA